MNPKPAGQRPVVATGKNFAWLDLLRGLAAVEGFLSHARTMFFLPLKDQPASLPMRLFFLGTSFAHESVIVFFVLSGFLIGRSVHLAQANNTWSPAAYAVDRVNRMWVVLLPGLLVTLVADRIGLALFPAAAGYTNGIEFLGDLTPAANLSVATFAGNALFLQNILVPCFGSDAPLWSLANEGWYYVIFPLVYFALFRRGSFVKRSLMAIAAMVVLWFTGTGIATYFLVWLLGTGAFYLSSAVPALSPPRNKWAIAILCLFVAGALALGKTTALPATARDFLLAVPVSVLLCCLVQAGMPGRAKKGIHAVAAMSFSLYVIHFPLLLAGSAWLTGSPTHFTARSAGLFAGCVLLVFTTAWLFWWLFESRYHRSASFIKARLGLLPAKNNSLRRQNEIRTEA